LETLAVWGLGHIGASIVLAARQRGLVETILGHDLDPTVTAAMAPHLEPVSKPECLQHADLLILAVPPMALASCFERIGGWLKHPGVISDVASVKEPVHRWASTSLDEERLAGFVPAHPIAGNEGKGLVAACADLFCNRPVVVTPSEITSTQAVDRICSLWAGLGARPILMDAMEHDLLLASLSHLPHALAFALARSSSMAMRQWEALGPLPSSFQGMVRIARSDPELWSQIFLLNREALLEQLDQLGKNIQDLQIALREEKLATIARWCADSQIRCGQRQPGMEGNTSD
jgi:prephenate dehydrogenase